MMAALQDIRMVSGELVKARFVRHLRTLTSGSGCTSGRNISLDAYRTIGGTVVICTSPDIDCRAIPEVDPSSDPADWGFGE